MKTDAMTFLRRPIRWWLALAILLAGLGICVPVYAGYLGELHPVFDTISHFRIHLAAAAAGVAAVLLFFRGWRAAATGLIALAALPVIATLGLPTLPQGAQTDGGEPPQPRYRLVHLNLRFDNPTPEAVLSMIGREKPDVITLAEVSTIWKPRLEVLRASYPYWVSCNQSTRNGGVAVLSRRPFAEGGRQECHDRGSLAIGTFDFGGRPVEVAALHLGWPWPFGQDWQVRNLAPVLGTLSETAVMAGDFNATPWSLMAQRVAQAGGLTFAGWAGPTWLDRRLPIVLKAYVGLPIDHVLTKGAVVPSPTRRLDSVGSDHLPLVMNFTLLPTEKAPGVQQAMVSAN